MKKYKQKYPIVLIALSALLFFLSACAVTTEAESQPHSIYFTTNEDDKKITDFEEMGMAIATSFDSLTHMAAEDPELQALYIGSDSLANLDSTWLKEIYRKGVLIGGVNEPVSSLAKKLGILTDMQDIDFAQTPEGFIVMTFFISLSEPSLSSYGTEGYVITSDYFPSITDAINSTKHYYESSPSVD